MVSPIRGAGSTDGAELCGARFQRPRRTENANAAIDNLVAGIADAEADGPSLMILDGTLDDAVAAAAMLDRGLVSVAADRAATHGGWSPLLAFAALSDAVLVVTEPRVRAGDRWWSALRDDEPRARVARIIVARSRLVAEALARGLSAPLISTR